MDQQADRRTHLRVPFNRDVHVMVNNTTLPPCPGSDISLGGIRLSTGLPVETRVHMLVYLPLGHETQALLLEGRVCWRKLNTCGVKFEKLSSWARVSLHEYLLSRASA